MGTVFGHCVRVRDLGPNSTTGLCVRIWDSRRRAPSAVFMGPLWARFVNNIVFASGALMGRCVRVWDSRAGFHDWALCSGLGLTAGFHDPAAASGAGNDRRWCRGHYSGGMRHHAETQNSQRRTRFCDSFSAGRPQPPKTHNRQGFALVCMTNARLALTLVGGCLLVLQPSFAQTPSEVTEHMRQ